MPQTDGRPDLTLTVDVVLLTIRDDRLSALAERRDCEPFAGALTLPGTSVGADESLDAAARRALTGRLPLAPDAVHLEQLATYGDPGRDPRGRSVSVAWLAIAPGLPEPSGDRREPGCPAAQWVPVRGLLGERRHGDAERGGPGRATLGFDHLRILQDGVERAASKLEYSTIGTAFCGAEFTIAELRRVYEVVWGRRLDPGNFHRKVTGAHGFVVETGATVGGRAGRPAQLYRRGPADLLHPPLIRTSFHPMT